MNENILFDLDGRKLLAHFDKNGHLFILDRQTGELQRAVPFYDNTWPTPEGTEICPGPAGAKEWPHASFSPQTQLLYTPVVDACSTFKLMRTEFRESMPYWGGDATVAATQVRGGAVKAFDPSNGREVWRWRSQHPIVASLLSTAGGVVFVGEPTGEFNALDARTGKHLWQFRTGSGIHSNPVTYASTANNMSAVPTGWGGWMKGFSPELYGATRGSALFVFSLP